MSSSDAFSVEAITRSTYERIAADYCATTPSREARTSVLRSLDQFAHLLTPCARVLVLGAGDGRDAEILNAQGFRTVSVDVTQAMLTLARSRLGCADLVRADIRNLPFQLESFGGVWAGSCMYHLRKASLPQAIDRIRAVLEPGGAFYMNLRRGSGERLDPAPRSYSRGGSRFYALYSWTEIELIIQDFELVARQDVDPVFAEDYHQVWLRK
jgi:ubiquinone/menaquinone biosynthesis C-methylase UbiE